MHPQRGRSGDAVNVLSVCSGVGGLDRGLEAAGCGVDRSLLRRRRAGRAMKFYLGAHMPHWLADTAVPLFVSPVCTWGQA